METLGIPDDQPIEHGLISKSIESAQYKIEGFNFDARKHVLEYDDVMNKQRTIVYGRRRQLLQPTTKLTEQTWEMIEKELLELVNYHFAQENFEIRQLFVDASAILPLAATDVLDSRDPIELSNHLTQIARRLWDEKKAKMGDVVFEQMQKAISLRAIDTLWQEHLDTMEHLRDSVRLRGYGQRDPLQEFKNEGFSLFQRLLDEINKQIVYTIYKVDLVPQPVVSVNRDQITDNIGRNDPCPCGSGKKWKKCHGK